MSWINFLSSRASFFAKRQRGKKSSSSQHAAIISFVMCKGGVGKTTSTRLLSKEMAKNGFRVLLIDADPQGNLTTSLRLQNLGFSIDESTPVLADIICEQAHFSEAILKISDKLSLLPSTAINSLGDKIMERGKISVRHLRQKLEPLLIEYDFIFFDTAPSLSLLNASIVLASDLVIHPICLDEFSRNGLLQTLQEVKDLNKKFLANVESKILVTRFSEDQLSQYYLAFLVQNYSHLMFNSMIRECPDIRDSVLSAGESSAELDYQMLTKELASFKQIEVSVDA